MSMKKVTRNPYMAVGMLGIIALLISPFETVKAASSYQFPKIINWAAADVGSVLYAIPATMVEKIAPALGSKIRMVPGSDIDRLNMMRGGKAQLATMAADTYWASMGLAHYCTFALGPQPIRIIWSGWPFSAGSTGLVSAASGIKTPYDLKGKRMGVVVGAAWSHEGVRANLAWAKLNVNDATIVEVSSTGAVNKALVEGKIDFTMGAANAPGFYEADASPYGAYLVRYSHDDKEGWERYRKIMPYHVPGYTTIGATIKPGEKVPTPMYPFPITICYANQPEEFVYALCKAIYSKMDEIVTAYPGNDAMKVDRATMPEITVMAPFHPGAVKFYKEIGKWSPALEEAQNKRIAQSEKVNKRWEVFVQEAKTKKKTDIEKEWHDTVEKEIGLLP